MFFLPFYSFTDGVAAPPPAPTVAPPIRGGRAFFEREAEREQRKVSREVSRETLRLPSQAQRVIEAVALRQVQKLERDELKRLEELTRELDLKGIEWETRYLEALNVRREALIDAEIAKLLKLKLEDEDTLLLMMLAASI